MPDTANFNHFGTTFKGITFTDAEGMIIKLDPDDWLFSTIDSKNYVLTAYPNPVTMSQNIVIPFYVQQGNIVEIEIINTQNILVKKLMQKYVDAIYYGEVVWNLTDNFNSKVLPGVYRCKFKLGDITGHGDIWVKPD